MNHKLTIIIAALLLLCGCSTESATKGDVLTVMLFLTGLIFAGFVLTALLHDDLVKELRKRKGKE